jgi:spore maturation protein CgeB
VKIFVCGSSIVSSYWNGAATYYRGIYKYLARRGHQITFAEPDAYGRQQHRDTGDYSYIESLIYKPHIDIDRMLSCAAEAGIVIKHSGLGVDDETLEERFLDLSPRCAVIFWDVDAPATLGRLGSNVHDPFQQLIPQYDAIITYGGGPLSRDGYLGLGARRYQSIYNGLDPETHHPVTPDPDFRCDVLFLGNRLPDREQRVDELFFGAALLAPDKQFVLGGEGWSDKPMPRNVRWIGHVSTDDHNRLNSSAGMVMNINRASMASFGFSPPTRVFEVAGAAGCLLCDDWPGVEDCFRIGEELVVVRSAQDVVTALANYDVADRRRIGNAFRARALRDHTYARRAESAERILQECLEARNAAASLAGSAA